MTVRLNEVFFSDGTSAFAVPELPLEPGRLYWIRGPNGSGKTTLLNALSRDAFGTASIFLLPQNYDDYIFEYHPVWWNISLSAIIDGAGKAKARTVAATLLSKYDLTIDLDRYPAMASGGEKQLMLLLRMLLQNPQVLLLDEPISGLDYERATEIWRLLSTLALAESKTVLFSSHQPPAVASLEPVAAFPGVRGKTIRIDRCHP